MRVVICLTGVFLSFASAHGEDLSERQALAKFLSSSPLTRALALQVDLARATARTEGLPPNGSLTFSREDAGGIPETYLLYHHPLAITGRRQLLRRAAEEAAESEEMRVALQLHEMKVDLRQSFLDVLLAQAQLKVLQAEGSRLEEIVDILRKRERAGESSGYDRIRAERELSLLAAEAGGLEGRLQRARGTLGSFLGSASSGETLVALGVLSLPSLPDLQSLTERALKRGDIQAERRLAESSVLSREAAHRKRLPEPILSGGLKSPVIDGRRDSGFVVSLVVPVPLFDRGSEEAARAEVARKAALARAEAIEFRVRQRLKGAWEETQSRLGTAQTYAQSAVTQTEDLVKIARAAYEGGEAGILELLDAHRTHLQVRLRALELAAKAKRSALELERLVGEEVVP